MTQRRSDLTLDVKDLLSRALVCESSEKIWDGFDKAMGTLDESSMLVLRHHFSGSSIGEIANKLQITERESKALVNTAKRQLVHNLRMFCNVRQ